MSNEWGPSSMQHVQMGLVGSGRVADRLGAALLVAENVTLKPVPDLSSLTQSGLDGLIIGENTDESLAYAKASMEAGLCVFIGTLAGLSLEQLIELRRAEFSASKPCLQFGFPMHHHDSIQAALAFAREAELGPLLSGRAVYGTAKALRDRRGAMAQHGYELLDLLHAFAGPFEDVSAMIDTCLRDAPLGEDNIMALLRTHRGTMVMLHASTTQWRHTFRLELTYANGSIWLDGLNKLGGDLGPEMLITAINRQDEAGEIQPNPAEHIREFEAKDISAAQMADFLSLVRGGPPAKHGTSQQAFDILNTADRILAADPNWFPYQGE